jgi:plastocyanin
MERSPGTIRSGVVILIGLVALGCGGGSAASITPPPDAAAAITARGEAFDTATLALPASASRLFFKNLDGFGHNVAIYTDSSAKTKVFVGQAITDAAVTYDIPTLSPGTYFFRCDLHPNRMVGTVTVAGG